MLRRTPVGSHADESAARYMVPKMLPFQAGPVRMKLIIALTLKFVVTPFWQVEVTSLTGKLDR